LAFPERTSRIMAVLVTSRVVSPPSETARAAALLEREALLTKKYGT
jgi:hypothetical protein